MIVNGSTQVGAQPPIHGDNPPTAGATCTTGVYPRPPTDIFLSRRTSAFRLAHPCSNWRAHLSKLWITAWFDLGQ